MWLKQPFLCVFLLFVFWGRGSVFVCLFACLSFLLFICLFVVVWFVRFIFVFAVNISVPRRRRRFCVACSNTLFPVCTLNPFHIAVLPPEVHRKRRQIAGRLPSEGDPALLLSHFGGVRWCLFWFSMSTIAPAMLHILTTVLTRLATWKSFWRPKSASKLPLSDRLRRTMLERTRRRMSVPFKEQTAATSLHQSTGYVEFLPLKARQDRYSISGDYSTAWVVSGRYQRSQGHRDRGHHGAGHGQGMRQEHWIEVMRMVNSQGRRQEHCRRGHEKGEWSRKEKGTLRLRSWEGWIVKEGGRNTVTEVMRRVNSQGRGKEHRHRGHEKGEWPRKGAGTPSQRSWEGWMVKEGGRNMETEVMRRMNSQGRGQEHGDWGHIERRARKAMETELAWSLSIKKNNNVACNNTLQRSGAVWKSRWPSPSLIVLMVSVDIKQH